MGQRFYNEKYPEFAQDHFYKFWWGKRGKEIKAKLHKAERRKWRREVNDLHVRKGYSVAVSDVDYKGW